ncbi:peroxynitrite isomerase THAP4-like isoform X1 [Osmerus eperlanus]|uniref:peroxynitrite isomerase THAP4-like isoform X1 n=1 Tax=Osmerus eperlanus TaxID=29151 RepID=UPI002E0D2402
MPDSCCAIGCTNRRGGKPGLCFYRIPSDKENPERRRLWICAIIKRNVTSHSGEGKQWQPSKYTRICSEHFIKGQPAYEMMETDPDWAPSLHLGHTEITRTNTARSARRRKREQRKNTLQPAEVDEQHTVDETHKAEGGGAKSDDPLSPDWVPSIFTHTPAIKKRKREKDMERYEQHNRMKNKRVEEKKKPDAVDVLLELSSEPHAELAPLEEEEQQCANRLCRENIERLQKECNELREENQRLRSSNVKWM